ncbi:uncharacterized protein LOC125711884 isoform X2 [Brienomyrus brachyistius]|uniref:uncharacterized protein LOC125711884 isoform X2 n=1 Tax=Brienomyrus brachyistius TaxID=42636 RepID=UPI0020B266A7|nr:uncharacterized protein LOC125711884 isoform X2 [Brienomyrus brachyistius]
MPAPHSSGNQWYCSLQQPNEGQSSELKRKMELQGCDHGARPIREAWDVALACDWLDADENKEIRVYLLKNILPTLIPCLEKLLREVEARGEVARGSATEESEAAPQLRFNPLNFLGHKPNEDLTSSTELLPHHPSLWRPLLPLGWTLLPPWFGAHGAGAAEIDGWRARWQFQGIGATAAGAGTQAGGAQSAQRSTGNACADSGDT